uniref:putative defense protein 3 n=1 Tax=Pristiophorus japonicus TaxID=55135 RepID=UPI00398F242D
MESSQHRICLALLGLLAFCSPASPFPTGAPLKVCESMRPLHNGVSAQTTTSPHTIMVRNTSSSMEVKIMGPVYGGILLQAREPGYATAIGNWSTPPQNTKAIKCFNMANSAITHSSNAAKNANTTYIWNPPTNCVKKVIIVATVAQNRETYWLNLQSEDINFTCSGAVKCMSGYGVLATFMVWSLLLYSEQ